MDKYSIKQGDKIVSSNDDRNSEQRPQAIDEGESGAAPLHSRREVISTLGKAAYIAPAMTVLSLGSIKAVAETSLCPPGNPGNPGEGNCVDDDGNGRSKKRRQRDRDR